MLNSHNGTILPLNTAATRLPAKSAVLHSTDRCLCLCNTNTIDQNTQNISIYRNSKPKSTDLVPNGSLYAVLIALLSYTQGLKAATEHKQIYQLWRELLSNGTNYLVHCCFFQLRPQWSLSYLGVLQELRAKLPGIINYTKQTLTSEADSHSSGHQIVRLLRNPKFKTVFRRASHCTLS